jgi:16S rRNA (guanine527-N7)-methyltransferase
MVTKAEVIERVSRETCQKLEVYVELLTKWNRTINLVSKSTLENVWERHIADSLQVMDMAPNSGQWVDLGSGGGLPGLIVAAASLESSPNRHVTLVESDSRKCAFMAAAANAMGLNVAIQCRRIEESDATKYDVISARALAPLSDLLELALPYRNEKTVCIFPKGEKADLEMAAAQRNWDVSFDTRQSMTDPLAKIFRIQEYSRVV